jgi:AraC-like DNA-binding protein
MESEVAMHQLYSTLPRKELRTFVRAFAQRKIQVEFGEIAQTIPAFLEHVIEFEFGALPTIDYGGGARVSAHPVSAIGPSAYRPANICFRGGVESFAVFFQPLAFSRLFSVQTSELTNTFANAVDLLGCEVSTLRNRMADNLTFDQRVALAEEWLLRKAAGATRITPITRAALYMLKHSGMARMNDVAHSCALCVRQFERRFVQETGITPKLFSRIARFQTVLDAKIRCPDLPWLSLSHEYGFFDQTHMIRDFQSLSGFCPELLLGKVGDMRPPALVASQVEPNGLLDSQLNHALAVRRVVIGAQTEGLSGRRY